MRVDTPLPVFEMPVERKPRIVHVSADFPDAVDPHKTKVIRALVDMTAEAFRHEVYSLNRISPSPTALLKRALPGGNGGLLQVESEAFEHGLAVKYHAPPKGILHAHMLDRLGDWLAAEIVAGERPDLIIGHKLTVEGFAVQRAARRLGIPFGLSIQGGTDAKILAARPDLHPRLRKIFHEAAVVFPFAPWSLAYTEARLGKRHGHTFMLPCPTELDEPMAPTIGGDELLSVFHLKSHPRKNLKAIVAAIKLLRSEGRETPLAIVGGGSDDDVAACRRIIGDTPGIELVGPLGRDAIRERMNRAIGFVLPSHRESYGLVFVEALFAGLPIVYPRDRAIAGYVDDCDFAFPADPTSPAEIARGLRALLDEEAKLKGSLAEWQSGKAAEALTRKEIAAQFIRGLGAGVEAGAANV